MFGGVGGGIGSSFLLFVCGGGFCFGFFGLVGGEWFVVSVVVKVGLFV